MNKNTLLEELDNFRDFFYLITPSESTYKTVEEVPSYIDEIIPRLFVLIILESLILLSKDKPIRINDTVGSLSAWILSRLPRLFMARYTELKLYNWIHENYCIWDLAWPSHWTWFLAFLAVDFFYYWLHRASHELNILWMAHQVHHSSEEFNLITSLRQPVLQNYIAWIFYLPLAFFFPSTVFLVHFELNYIYQFWLHTEVIGKLGPLEYVLNTPSHHRVHHGRNRYCLDKNYGGVFIIFDKIFGTFENEGETVVMGLVYLLNSFDPVWTQLSHLVHMISTYKQMSSLENKLSVIFKGPSWSPGKPRLGIYEEKPDVKAPQPKYDPYLPPTWRTYIGVHFLLIIVLFLYSNTVYLEQGYLPIIVTVCYIIISLSVLGMLCDTVDYALQAEILRCLLSMGLCYNLVWNYEIINIWVGRTIFSINIISLIFLFKNPFQKIILKA